MDIILWGLVILAAVWILSAVGRASKGPSAAASRRAGTARADTSRSSGKQAVLDANRPWLQERWHLAETEKAAGNLQHFPRWYFDEATDRQRNRLAEDGVTITRSATKGQHSDVIGLFEDPEPEDLEKLKFFSVVLKGPLRNQTRARHEVARLDADPEKQQAWRMRPATAIQKEFYRFIGEKPPSGVTFDQAQAKMTSALDAMDDARQDEWSAFESLLDEFDDRELRSDLEIRKPTPADIRAAMAALKAEGKKVDDPYDVAEKLLELKPSLRRSSTS